MGELSKHMIYEWSKERELFDDEMWSRFYNQKVDMVVKDVDIVKIQTIHRPLMNITENDAIEIANRVGSFLVKQGHICKTGYHFDNDIDCYRIDVEYIGEVRTKQQSEHLELKKIVHNNLEKPNKFLHNYKLEYENIYGHKKIYEIVSRNSDLKPENFGESARKNSDAVGMIMFNTDMSKILLQKEFRLACGEWVYNIPGGLIDKGESVEDAVRRELKEETGLDLISILKVLPSSYTAVGLSNESVITFIGIADGEFSNSTSEDEEIEARWYSTDEVLDLINEGKAMSLRTQTLLYMWATNEQNR